MEALDELAARDVKALVVACNTSTAVALRDLRARYDLPVLGVVRPGAAAAALATRNRRVGVIATPATVRSHAYFNAIKDENPAVEVYEHATPRFVPMVEAGHPVGPGARGGRRRGAGAAARRARRRRASSCSRGRRRRRIDTLLLGCTHYPLLRPVHRRGRGRPGGDRRLGDRDGVVAGRAAVGQRARGAGHDARHGRRRGRGGPRAAGRGVRRPATHVQLTTGDVERFRVDRDADVRRGVPGRGSRSSCAAVGGPGDDRCRRRRRAGRSRAGSARRHPRRAAVAGRVPRGSVLGRRVTVAGRQLERSAREAGLVDWGRVERIAIARLRSAPGRAVGRASCARPRASTPRRWRGSCPALARAPRHRAAGRRRPGRGRRPGGVGPGEHVRVRAAHPAARGRAAGPDAPARGGLRPRRR